MKLCQIFEWPILTPVVFIFIKNMLPTRFRPLFLGKLNLYSSTIDHLLLLFNFTIQIRTWGKLVYIVNTEVEFNCHDLCHIYEICQFTLADLFFINYMLPTRFEHSPSKQVECVLNSSTTGQLTTFVHLFYSN